ncbi:uncharacterized protein LOC113309459 [Papaver somniferum]|uniref:uncharacterized protein LOC113309459 n=1 Tax=Papaver somniferum TaxID=3469 RepID=UPI000E6F699A|nr:uncharacterized protein LOC113309459 [Papaver somniferum]
MPHFEDTFAMEFSNSNSELRLLDKKTSPNRKIEPMGAAPELKFDALWILRWPLEDITSYYNNLISFDEADPNSISVEISSSKENLGPNSVQPVCSQESVIKNSSEAKIITGEVSKGNALRKGFR